MYVNDDGPLLADFATDFPLAVGLAGLYAARHPWGWSWPMWAGKWVV